MKSKLFLTTVFLSAATPSAFAVEGAIGRPVSGTLINPFAAVVPPAPGFTTTVGEIYYDADTPIPPGSRT